MNSEYIKSLKFQTEFIDNTNNSENCMVSRASAELMLDRFSNGKEIDFPFQDN